MAPWLSAPQTSNGKIGRHAGDVGLGRKEPRTLRGIVHHPHRFPILVDGIHINGSVVSVDIAKGHTAEGLKEIIEDLYTYYRPGVEVPQFPAPAE